jgi:hypothetical protein
MVAILQDLGLPQLVVEPVEIGHLFLSTMELVEVLVEVQDKTLVVQLQLCPELVHLDRVIQAVKKPVRMLLLVAVVELAALEVMAH